MILTIEQAKTKWCPMSRSWVEKAASINRAESLFRNEVVMCIADKCMMWEWEKKPVYTRYYDSDRYLKQHKPEWVKSENIDWEDGENSRLSEEYLANAREEIKSWNPPLITGWELVETFVDEDENWGYFMARYERDFDPNATGYCGLSRQR